MVLLILFIVLMTLANIYYIRYKISKPFDYLVKQMKNKEPIDPKKLHNTFEFERVSQLYDELRKMQLLIEAKNKELKKDNKDFILSSIHQLKTPLSAIMMNIELLEMHTQDEKLQEYINQVKAAVDMLNLNSEELVYLSMQKDIDYKVSRVNLTQVLQERINFFHHIATANEKEIAANIDRDIFISMNPIELERLIDNNISNAIKYSDPKSTITITLTQDSNQTLLSFESQGKTIKNDQKLFEKGYRESEDKNGYGLGLYIIKSICDKYEIMIDLKSKQNVTLFQYIW